LAASLEQFSEHPLARAIVGRARQKNLPLVPVDDFVATPGGGVRGGIAGRAVLAGSQKFMTENSITLPATGIRSAESGNSAMTMVYVAVDSKVVGGLHLADRIRPSSRDALRTLRNEGLKIVMLTGDRREAAENVARQLTLDEVRAELSPQQKAQAVRELRDQGHNVAMAGDGINDAPALSVANVGIAMGTGTDVAIQNAGITLIKGDLRAIVRARQLSRAATRNIRQNLAFAFLYNALGIPVAAGAFYPLFGWLLSPMLASAAMSLSSVSVIGNALRLRNTKL
jgi:Cu+-exporting ATPase